jgi:hypothetical protein
VPGVNGRFGRKWSVSVYGEYVGGLVSDCHGRLGQDDAIEVEEKDELDGMD